MSASRRPGSKLPVIRPETGSDVEGHGMLLDPTLARDLAKARERDIQRSVRDRQRELDARRPHRK